MVSIRPARPQPGLGRTGGFTLIELLVGVSILAILLGMALPAFNDWVRNNNVRYAAETLREGLQTARSEAVKRNTRVRLNLVSSLDSSCALSTAGQYWVINMGSAITPAGACANAISTTVSPYILQMSPVTASTTKVTVTSTQSVIAFDGSGRMSSTTVPTTTPSASITVDIISTSGTCVASSGTVRCLRLVVSIAGQVRMCDPSVSTTTDPTRC